jgi:Ca-activated chloride channel homolog
MSEFHFLRPWWLLAFLPLLALMWRMRRLERTTRIWERICDPALLPHVLSFAPGLSPDAGTPKALLALGGSLAIVAMAGPVWERLPTPAFRNDAALVIALDLSRVMDAADIKPSRLERARYRIADVLKQRKDGLTALLVYSGEAFVVTPLTDDGETIRSQLTALTSELMPAQGSRADLALALAEKLLLQAGLPHGDILLMTDGINLGTAETAAEKLKSQGYRLSVLGVGSEEGAPVPLPEGGFLQDSKGAIVISKLAAPAMRQLAGTGGGLYRTLAMDGSDLPALLDFFGQRRDAAGTEASVGVNIEQWAERGPWLLLALLPIAALAFRRGYLGLLLFFIILPAPRGAQALEWKDLWQTPDQQAQQAFAQGEHQRAAEQFQNPNWRAAAQYKSGQYEEAAKGLSGADTAEAQYNRGNALARLGRYPDAIQAYDKALARNPQDEDARYNKELVEKALKDQEEQQQKQSSSGQDKEQNKQKGEKGDEPEQDADKSQDPGKKDSADKPEQGEKEQSRDRGEHADQDKPAEQAERGKEDQRQTPSPAESRAEKSDEAEEAQAQQDQHRSEDQQAGEQWLRRIPDDPGGLLRRKFYYQYQQRQGQRPGAQR